MKATVEMVKNAAGRIVPVEVNGRVQRPYPGVDKFRPQGEKHAPAIRTAQDFPASGDKRVASLAAALEQCGLKDGMTLSTHHHLRNGDRVAVAALHAAAELGARDLMWFPSASFPCHEPVIELMDKRVVHHIEGSLNGPLGEYCSRGRMRGTGVLRSHGGRWQAIQDGGGPHRHRHHRRPQRRPLWKRRRLSRAFGLRLPGFRPRRFHLRGQGDRGHGQPGRLSLCALADPGKPRGRGGGGRLHRRPEPDRLRDHRAHPEPGPAPHSGVRGPLCS